MKTIKVMNSLFSKPSPSFGQNGYLMKNSFITSGCNTSAISLTTRKRSSLIAPQFNITDTLIKVLKGGFLKLESPYGSSFVTILPVGKFPVQFNGFHLGEFIQRLNFPVELRIKAEFIDTGKIKGRMGRSNTRYQKHHGRGRKY